MKSILFLVGSLDSGGVSKSVVNTLNAIDYSHYDVDLLVMSGKTGVFGRFLPVNVNIIYNETISNALCGFKGVVNFLKTRQLKLAFKSITRMALSRVNRAKAGLMLSRIFPLLDKEYDLIVDYNGQQQLYYMVDRLKGRKKVTFFHSDYNKWPYYKAADRRYFPLVDKIFTISNQCVKSLKENFPNAAHKVSLFENITSASFINQLALEQADMPPVHGHVLVTIGHVWYDKGIDLAIKAAAIMKKDGIDFTWLFIGRLAEQKWVKLAKRLDLTDSVAFLGIIPNPYPYIKRADIVVHPSRFEGKSIALDEAKILCKPIVATNFSTVGDQLTDGVHANICQMNGESLADAIINLISDPDKCKRYSQNLKADIVDNSSEVEKLYSLIEGS